MELMIVLYPSQPSIYYQCINLYKFCYNSALCLLNLMYFFENISWRSYIITYKILCMIISILCVFNPALFICMCYNCVEFSSMSWHTPNGQTLLGASWGADTSIRGHQQSSSTGCPAETSTTQALTHLIKIFRVSCIICSTI